MSAPLVAATSGHSRISDVEHLREWVLAASDLVRAVNAERPVSRLLGTVAEQAHGLLGLDMCGVFIANEPGTELVIQGSSGLSDRYLERLRSEQPLLVGATAGAGLSPSALAYATGRTVAIPDVRASEEMAPWRQLALQEGYEALIATPLREGEKVVGVIVGYALQPRPFTEPEIDMLAMLAVHAGTALQAARLRDDARRMIEELNSANAKLRNQRYRLEAIDRQHRRLMQVMANDVGLNGVMNMLAELLEASITLQDPHGGILGSATRGAYVGPPTIADREHGGVREALDEVRARRAGCVEVKRGHESTYPFWVAPVALDNEVVAFLWVGGPGVAVDDLGKVAIERFAMALALELSKQRHAAQVRLRLSRDLVADLLAPIRQSDRTALIERAEAMGHDLRMSHQVLIARPDGKRAGAAPGQGMLEVADSVIRKHAPGSIVGGVKGDVVILLPRPEGVRGTDLAKLLIAEFRRRNSGRTASVVVGGVAHDIADIAGHHRAGRGAAKLADDRHDSVIDIEGLGVASLLLSHGDVGALRVFAQDTLRPLIEHDERRHVDLVLTLRRWLESDCNTARTAEILIVHPNTVNYRLKVVEELLGRPLRSQAFLVELDIALMILDVLGDHGD